MKRTRRGLVACCAVLLFLPLLAAGCALFGRGAAPARMPQAGGGGPAGFQVLAFYDDRDEKARGVVLDTLVRNKALISELSPFWYKVNRDGSLTDMSEKDVLAFAERNGIRLMPLVTNQAGNDAFLTDPAARSRAVANLLALLDRNSRTYEGFSIDFQLLSPGTRDGLTSFMRSLYAGVKKRGKSLNIDVIPTGQATNRSSPYDLPALAKVSDAIVLMTYDNHSDASRPGPVAGLEWVRTRIQAAEKAGVAAGRLMMGVAAYGYDWVQGTANARTVSLKEAKMMLGHAAPVRGTPDLSPHFTYTAKDGRPHVVWYEDGTSVAQKVKLARDMGLRGIAIWHVGQEDQSYWDAIRGALR